MIFCSKRHATLFNYVGYANTKHFGRKEKTRQYGRCGTLFLVYHHLTMLHPLPLPQLPRGLYPWTSVQDERVLSLLCPWAVVRYPR